MDAGTSTFQLCARFSHNAHTLALYQIPYLWVVVLLLLSSGIQQLYGQEYCNTYTIALLVSLHTAPISTVLAKANLSIPLKHLAELALDRCVGIALFAYAHFVHRPLQSAQMLLYIWPFPFCHCFLVAESFLAGIAFADIHSKHVAPRK